MRDYKAYPPRAMEENSYPTGTKEWRDQYSKQWGEGLARECEIGQKRVAEGGWKWSDLKYVAPDSWGKNKKAY